MSNRQLLGTLQLLIWPDVVPKACQVLRHYVEKDYDFEFSLMVNPPTNDTRAYRRHVRRDGALKYAVSHPLPEAMQDIEKTSALWSLPSYVCFKISDEEPHVPELVVLNTNLTYLAGKQPESAFGQVSEFGVVIGKVLLGPIDLVTQVAAFDHKALEEFEVAKEERTWKDGTFSFPASFQCAVLDN